MAGRKREVRVASSDSVVGELYGLDDDDDDETPAPARRPNAVASTAAEPAPETATAASPKSRRRTGTAPHKSTGTRPDAEGMRRWSLYSTEASAASFDAAVERLRAALGPDTPKQIAISALLEYAAAGVEEVEADLIAARTRELQARLAALQHRA